jgi:hypothetical protein
MTKVYVQGKTGPKMLWASFRIIQDARVFADNLRVQHQNWKIELREPK